MSSSPPAAAGRHHTRVVGMAGILSFATSPERAVFKLAENFGRAASATLGAAAVTAAARTSASLPKRKKKGRSVRGKVLTRRFHHCASGWSRAFGLGDGRNFCKCNVGADITAVNNNDPFPFLLLLL